MTDLKDAYERINVISRKSKEYYLIGIHAKNSFRNFSRLFSKMSEEDCSASWCEHAILELGRCTKLCFYSLMYLYSRAIKFAKSRCIAPIRYAIIRAYLMGGKSYGKY